MQNPIFLLCRRFKRLVVAALVGAAACLWLVIQSAQSFAAPLLQDQVKIGALKFTPPKDWTPTRATSRVLLAFAPPDLLKGRVCQVRVFADEVSKEAFSAWFTRRWNALMSGKPKLRTSEL